MNIPISLKEVLVSSYQARPNDTQFHLRRSYDKELQNMMEAEIFEPMGLRESEWCSRAFPVLKSDGCSALWFSM